MASHGDAAIAQAQQRKNHTQRRQTQCSKPNNNLHGVSTDADEDPSIGKDCAQKGQNARSGERTSHGRSTELEAELAKHFERDCGDNDKESSKTHAIE